MCKMAAGDSFLHGVRCRNICALLVVEAVARWPLGVAMVCPLLPGVKILSPCIIGDDDVYCARCDRWV